MAYLSRKLPALVRSPQMMHRPAELSFRPLGGTGDTLRAPIDEGRSRWGKTITEAGIRLD